MKGSLGSSERSSPEERIKSVLEEFNPWWRDEKWYLGDEDLSAVEESGIVPRIKFWAVKNWIKPIIESEDNWGIIVIRGPRRIGKTTLLKLLIREALELNVDRENIIYVSLDIEELRRSLVRGEVSLRGLLSQLILERKKRGRVFLFIDEATFYMEWASALKNLVDSHVIGPGVLVMVTGSYSLELSQAKRELEGRMGSIGKKAGGQRFYYPLRFSEVLDSVSEDVRVFLNEDRHYGGRKSLRMLYNRLRVLEDLSSPGNTRVLEFFEDMKSKIGDVAKAHFEKLYLYTGGFPSALYSFIKKSGMRYVGDDQYTVFYDLLVRDAEKFTIWIRGKGVRLSSDVLEKILKECVSDRPAFMSTWDDLQIEIAETVGGVRSLKLYEAQAYMQYLIDGARVLLKMDPVVVRDRMTVHTRSLKNFKLVYLDPFMFTSVFWVSRGVRSRIYDSARSLLEGAGTASRVFRQLYEAVVCSHIARIPSIKYGVDTPNYGVGYSNGHEFADCVAWYYDKMYGRQRIFAVEVTTSEKPGKDEYKAKAMATYRELMGSRLIVATRDFIGLYEYCDGVEAIFVPASLLLLLI